MNICKSNRREKKKIIEKVYKVEMAIIFVLIKKLLWFIKKLYYKYNNLLYVNKQMEIGKLKKYHYFLPNLF